ncbi:MAG: 50S ribosomal protein L34e [Candidatus Aenigmatarchaeota archaeon]
MPRPALRSSKMRWKKVKKPSGEIKIVYKRPRPAKPKCAKCKGYLAGVPITRRPGLLNKSKRRPERTYGGYLCPKCLKIELKEKIYKLAT